MLASHCILVQYYNVYIADSLSLYFIYFFIIPGLIDPAFYVLETILLFDCMCHICNFVKLAVQWLFGSHVLYFIAFYTHLHTGYYYAVVLMHDLCCVPYYYSHLQQFLYELTRSYQNWA